MRMREREREGVSRRMVVTIHVQLLSPSLPLALSLPRPTAFANTTTDCRSTTPPPRADMTTPHRTTTTAHTPTCPEARLAARLRRRDCSYPTPWSCKKILYCRYISVRRISRTTGSIHAPSRGSQHVMAAPIVHPSLSSRAVQGRHDILGLLSDAAGLRYLGAAASDNHTRPRPWAPPEPRHRIDRIPR